MDTYEIFIEKLKKIFFLGLDSHDTSFNNKPYPKIFSSPDEVINGFKVGEFEINFEKFYDCYKTNEKEVVHFLFEKLLIRLYDGDLNHPYINSLEIILLPSNVKKQIFYFTSYELASYRKNLRKKDYKTDKIYLETINELLLFFEFFNKNSMYSYNSVENLTNFSYEIFGKDNVDFIFDDVYLSKT